MAVEAPAFSLELGPGGFFPGHRGNTLWQGVKPCPSLAALQRQLWSELTRRGFSLRTGPFCLILHWPVGVGENISLLRPHRRFPS